MYTFATQSKAIFGFNFRNSVQHMASSFRVDPVFNYTFVPVSSLFVLCCIAVFLPKITFLTVRFPICACFNVCVCISCLSLLSYALILHCPCSVIFLFVVCVCCLNFSVSFQRSVYLCQTLSPKLDVFMRVWKPEKRGQSLAADLKHIFQSKWMRNVFLIDIRIYFID